MTEKKKTTYRILFHNRGKIYEVYARSVSQATMFGFVEIEELLFGERTQVVVDPAEEDLKSEFKGVSRFYVPMHAVIRIDEVARQGTGRITEGVRGDGSITPFPVAGPGRAEGPEGS